MSIGKQVYSIASLGVAFCAHVLSKPFVDPATRGRARFDENFREDHLTPYTPKQFERLTRYERCLNCGLCDAACAASEAGRNRSPDAVNPSLIPISVSRAQPLFHTAAGLAAFYAACGDCRACEDACPNRVPIKEIAAMVAGDAVRTPAAV